MSSELILFVAIFSALLYGIATIFASIEKLKKEVKTRDFFIE